MLNRDYLKKVTKEIRKSEDDSSHLFWKYTSQFNEDEMQRFYKWIVKSPVISNKLRKLFFPHNVQDLLKRGYVFNEQEDKVQLYRWFKTIIIENSERINDFLLKRMKYENHLFKEDFQSANQELVEIEELFGFSTWLLSQKFIVIEYLEGYEENKKYLEELQLKAGGNAITSAIMDFLSLQAERNTSYNNYNDKLSEFVKTIDSEVVKGFMEAMLGVDFKENNGNPQETMQLVLQHSIIDQYDTFIDSLMNESDMKSYISLVSDLSGVINDKRLLNILIYEDEISYNQLQEYIISSKVSLELHNEVFDKNSVEGVGILPAFLEEHSYDFETVLLYLNSTATISNKKFFDNSLLQSIYNLISFNSTEESNIYYYIKMLRNTSWRYKLPSLLLRKTGENSKLNLSKLANLSDSHFNLANPAISNYILNSIEDKLMVICPAETKYRLAFKNFSIEADQVSHKDSFKWKKYIFTKLLRDERYSEVEKLIDLWIEDSKSTSEYLYEKYIRMKYHVLMSNSRYKDAVELLAESFLRNKNILRRIEIEKLYNNIRRTRDREVKKCVDNVIFMSVYGKRDNDISIALSNFLEKNSLSSITQVLDYTDGLEKNKREFLLYRVCTRGNMEIEATLVKSNIESANARIEILDYLAKTDKHNDKIYHDEKEMIQKELIISDRVKSINNSKITIDVARIEEDYGKIFLENYNRFLETKQFKTDVAGIDITSDSFLKQLNFAIENTNIAIKEDKNEGRSFIEFRNLVHRLTSELLFNEDYGLDRYLSTRIRHGHVKSQLVDIFNDHNLISIKASSSSDNFGINPFWSSKFAHPDLNCERMLNELSRFTTKIESKIDEVAKKWIRIKLGADDTGLIDFYGFVDQYVSTYFSTLGSPESYSAFYTGFLRTFWELLDIRLSSLREFIKKNLTTYFLSELEALERSIVALSLTPNVHSIFTSEINRVRAEIAIRVNAFADTIMRKSVKYNEFTTEDMIDTCREIYKRMNSGFDLVNFRSNYNEKQFFDGQLFPHLVDIGNNLINNALVHSKFDDLSALEINVNSKIINKDDNDFESIRKQFADSNLPDNSKEYYILSVSNSLSKKVDLNLLAAKVTEINKKLHDPELVKKYVISEGGTGFYKIGSVLRNQLDGSFLTMMFIYEEGLFEYRIILNQKCLEGKKNENIVD